MEIWVAECWNLLDGLLGSPSGTATAAIYRIVGFLVMMFVFEYTGYALGARRVGLLSVILALVVGVCILVVAHTVTKLCIVPSLPRSDNGIIQIVITALITLLVGVPLQCLLRKSKFFAMSVAFGASLLAVFLVMYALNAVTGSLREGGKKSDSIRQRKYETERLIYE